jgi:hypothetical protein
MMSRCARQMGSGQTITNPVTTKTPTRSARLPGPVKVVPRPTSIRTQHQPVGAEFKFIAQPSEQQGFQAAVEMDNELGSLMADFRQAPNLISGL